MTTPRRIDRRSSSSATNETPTFTSFKRLSVASGAGIDDSNFVIGDFSARKFNNHGSLIDHPIINAGFEKETKSPNAVTIEGGFEEIDTGINLNDDLTKSITSRKPSAISNLYRNSSNTNSAANLQFANTSSGALSGVPDLDSIIDGTNESVAPSEAKTAAIDLENPDPKVVEVIERHLVTPQLLEDGPITEQARARSPNPEADFDSLRLQGGDITRGLYNWTRNQRGSSPLKRSNSVGNSRSSSFAKTRSESGLESPININDIRMPGGFRRSFLHQKRIIQNPDAPPPNFLTRNFIEFLSIYGHFAGEELNDEDEDEEYSDNESVFEREPHEETRLLPRRIGSYRHEPERNVTTTKAVLLLLKAFIGTGVLFLPKGFLNGGMLLSGLLLLFFSVLSYYCFIILIEVRVVTSVSSYGDIGQLLFGNSMRQSILTSIVLSQIGFAAAYIVFVATNLQALVSSILDYQLSIVFFIAIQLVVFVPLSLTRKIEKLSFTALIADLFILLGLVYVYYYSSFTVLKHGVADIELFNPNSWTLFVGTAIFTYEGIGLLIPIQESMKNPSHFKPTLLAVIIFITVVFITVGSICYMAFGSEVQTVIILNFPKGSPAVNTVQLLYALAILLSTPLQLFPAIKILENGVFKRSGKYKPKVKWTKNFFRLGVVIVTGLISAAGSSDLDKFVSLIGSFACIPLIYIYPPLLHLKSCDLSLGLKTLDIAVLVFGVAIMAYTSLDTIIHW